MTDLTRTIETALASPHVVDRAEAIIAALPQEEAPVFHRFGPGIYIREVHMRAGLVVTGHHHRHAHMNVMVSGALILYTDAGPVHLVAPQTFVAPPGRKAASILEDVIWQNVYATDLTDIDALDAWMFDRSAVALSVDDIMARANPPEAQPDPPAWPYGEVAIPPGCAMRSGALHATAPYEAGAVMGLAPLGRLCRHSAAPSARLERTTGGAMVLVTTRRLAGCVGGSKGDAVTVDYHAAARVLRGDL